MKGIVNIIKFSASRQVRGSRRDEPTRIGFKGEGAGERASGHVAREGAPGQATGLQWRRYWRAKEPKRCTEHR